MDSDTIIASLMVVAAFTGAIFFIRMVWRRWKYGDERASLDPTAGEMAPPLDVILGESKEGHSGHHHDGAHDSGHSTLGGDHGMGHFDGGHHH